MKVLADNTSKPTALSFAMNDQANLLPFIPMDAFPPELSFLSCKGIVDRTTKREQSILIIRC